MVIQAMYILSNNSAGEPVKLDQFKLPLSDICLIQFHKLHLPVPQNTLKKWALENDWNGIHQNNIVVKECPISIVTSDKNHSFWSNICLCDFWELSALAYFLSLFVQLNGVSLQAIIAHGDILPH